MRADGIGTPGDPLPYGDARLMWSFNRDDEADPRLSENLNTGMNVDEMRNRERRRYLAELAHRDLCAGDTFWFFFRVLDSSTEPGTLVFVPAMLVGLWFGLRTKNLKILTPKGAC